MREPSRLESVRERRRRLREELAQARARARASLDANPAVQRARRRRNRRRAAWAAAILLAALFSRCDCDTEEAAPELRPSAPPSAPMVQRPAIPAKAPRRPRKELDPEGGQKQRGELRAEPLAPPAWLEALRLQVGARSARLAECFRGADRPGALRWTVSVAPERGTVSDHELTPLGRSGELDATQRACLIEALSKPSYRLGTTDVGDGATTSAPLRTSLVVEF